MHVEEISVVEIFKVLHYGVSHNDIVVLSIKPQQLVLLLLSYNIPKITHMEILNKVSGSTSGTIAQLVEYRMRSSKILGLIHYSIKLFLCPI